MRKDCVSTKENASTERRRKGIRGTLIAAMEPWAGSGVLVLLFLASLAYVVFGGKLALEASPAPEQETSMAAVAPEPADEGGTPRKEIVSARSETEKR